jgi:hypothetical protein
MSYLSRGRVAGAMSVTRKKGEGTEGEEGKIDVPGTSQQHWILRDRHRTRASPGRPQRAQNLGEATTATM